MLKSKYSSLLEIWLLKVSKPGIFMHSRRLGVIFVVTVYIVVRRQGRRHAGSSCRDRCRPSSPRRLAKGGRKRRRPEALEDVVLACVVVPVLISGAYELQAELKLLSDHASNPGVVDGEGEFVREPVAGAVQVDGVHVRRSQPLVGGVANHYRFIEIR